MGEAEAALLASELVTSCGSFSLILEKGRFGCHYLSTIPHISDWHVALGSWQSGVREANFRAYVVAKWAAIFFFKTTIVIVV